jgi:hypothetical protein
MTKETDEKEILEGTIKFLDSQLDAVQGIITYVLAKSNLTEDEIKACEARADAIITSLGEESRYLGELILSVCFCYDGSLRTLLGMVQEKMKPAASMSIDEIATEMFQSIKRTKGKPS